MFADETKEEFEENFNQMRYKTVTTFIQGSLLCISEVMQSVLGEVFNQYDHDPSKAKEE